MFGLVLVSDGQNEGPLNNGSDIYCSACSPLVWDNLGLFHMYNEILVDSSSKLFPSIWHHTRKSPTETAPPTGQPSLYQIHAGKKSQKC